MQAEQDGHLLHQTNWAVFTSREARDANNLSKDSLDTGTGLDVALKVPPRTKSPRSLGALFTCDMAVKVSPISSRAATDVHGFEGCDAHENDRGACGTLFAHLRRPMPANVSHCASQKHRQK